MSCMYCFSALFPHDQHQGKWIRVLIRENGFSSTVYLDALNLKAEVNDLGTYLKRQLHTLR